MSRRTVTVFRMTAVGREGFSADFIRHFKTREGADRMAAVLQARDMETTVEQVKLPDDALTALTVQS